MVKNVHNTSPEFIIHPGESLEEAIIDRNVTQSELAKRTGFSEKHISTVINGLKGISAEFAISLEYALDIPASFWCNLQRNYDLEIAKFNDIHEISSDEIQIAMEIKDPIMELVGNKPFPQNNSELTLEIRKLIGFRNLLEIQSMKNSTFYRAQFDNNTSPNVMYVWQYLCEIEAQNQTNKKLNIKMLENEIDNIKNIMHSDGEKHEDMVKSILNECGISFVVKKHVSKAPIKGLTSLTRDGHPMIAMTILGGYVDSFWFTLFHEIYHVINSDYNKNQSNVDRIVFEKMADDFAANILINKGVYLDFIAQNNFSVNSILSFAKRLNVLPTIVIGRLIHDGYINSKDFDVYRLRYEFIENTR